MKDKYGVNRLDFFDEEELVTDEVNKTYKVVIADDEPDVHQVTSLILRNFRYKDHKIDIVDLYSGQETMTYFEDHSDVAVLFLDVVMEDKDSGLEVVKYIREQLVNKSVRIILRTGQPGQAPEEEVIRDYDINDYRLKTDMTDRRLKTSMYTALRAYNDILKLERHRQGLEKIIKASGKLFENNTLDDFLVSILNELSNLHVDANNMLFIREKKDNLSGFVAIEEEQKNKIVAGTGQFACLVGREVESVSLLHHISEWLLNKRPSDQFIHQLDPGFIIEGIGKSKIKNYIYIDGREENFDFELINLFLSHFAIALDNYILNNVVTETQKEIVYALSETVESHFEETGSHTKRISEMMYQFALCNNFSYAESELIKLASTMHDLGKVAIADDILKKPGKLTEEEFTIMKTHAAKGYKILNNSDLPVLKLAAEIALNHHEKYDGGGYPRGLKSRDIPLSARMMAIVDVYDAMTHKRVYKDAISVEETLATIKALKNSHFDGHLVDIFIREYETITKDVHNM